MTAIHFDHVSSSYTSANPVIENASFDLGDRLDMSRAGKTSLLEPLGSTVAIPPNKLLYLSEETTLADARRFLNEVLQLSGDDLGRVMTLGADPGALRASDRPSPGETTAHPRRCARAKDNRHHLVSGFRRLDTCLNGSITKSAI